MKLIENDFESFFQVPFKVYPKNSPFVSLFKDDLKRFLDPKKNPLFQNGRGEMGFVTAIRDGEPIGRLVVHVHNLSNQRHNFSRAYFGFFDCENSLDTANLLHNYAQDWARKRNLREIIGNFNLTAMQQIGVMTQGFDKIPFTDQVYSPEHIADLLEKLGYKRNFPSTTFELDLNHFDPQSLIKSSVQTTLNDSNFLFKSIKRNEIKRAMQDARHVLNKGFDKNPMFVPVSEEEFQFQAKDMMWIIDERISSLCYHQGKPVGVVVCIPDLNPFLKKINSRMGLKFPVEFIKSRLNRKRAVIIYYSVDPDFGGRGIAGAMLYHVTSALKKSGYEKLGITWIADINHASLAQMKRLGATTLHNLHLFEKKL